MRILRHGLTLVALVMITSGVSGCQLFEALPRTTWKLNRGPALDEGQAYFSVPDPTLTNAESSSGTVPE